MISEGLDISFLVRISICFLLQIMLTTISSNSTVAAQLFDELLIGEIVNRQGHTFSASWGDVDGDGVLDLFVANGNRGGVDPRNILYRNNGDNSFTNISDGKNSMGRENTPAGLWIDYDEDGDLDLIATNLGGTIQQFRNDGLGEFIQIHDSFISNLRTSSRKIGPADFDNDGDLDLFISQRRESDNILLRNTGFGVYERVSDGIIVQDGGDSTCIEWADIDNDHDLDVLVCNAFGNNFLYENLGDGRFGKNIKTPITNDGGRSGGGSWADFDSDGDLDLYVANVDEENNFYYRNEGDWLFTKVTEGDHVNSGGSSNSSTAIDVDNDGDLDLFVTNLTGPNQLFLNDGNGHFVRALFTGFSSAGQITASAAWGDFDRDGDLDVYLSNLTDSKGDFGKNQLLINTTQESENNWLHLRLKGVVSNNHAVGARIRVVAGELGNGSGIIREINGGSGSSTGAYEVAFGLGHETMVDSLEVSWPSGLLQFFTDVEPNQILDLLEPNAAIVHNPIRAINPHDDIQIDSEIQNFDLSLQSVKVFYRLVGSSNYLPIEAVEIASGHYRVTIKNVVKDAEYYIRADFLDFSIQDGSPDSPHTVIIRTNAPRIESVVDVPHDDGRRVLVNWFASVLDVDIDQLPFYSVWRSVSVGKTSVTSETSMANTLNASTSTIVLNNGNSWEWLSNQPALRLESYSFAAETLFDRSSSTDGKHLFMVVAHTANPNIFYESDPVGGYSIGSSDNIGVFSEDEETLPEHVLLTGNYPNPFSSTTTIAYTLPDAEFVTIEMFDMLGRRIQVLVADARAGGTHEVMFDGTRYTAGTYFYVIRTGKTVEKRALVLVK